MEERPLTVAQFIKGTLATGLVGSKDDFDFAEKLEELNEELEVLNTEARELEDRIAANVAKLLEALA